MKYRGIAHIHTSYSDGDHTPSEIARHARKENSFMLLTEHAEHLTPEDYERLVEECRSLSNPDFLMVPGLEFSYPEYTHVLAYFIGSHPGELPLEEIVGEIKARNGLSVLAHANTCGLPDLSPLKDIGGWRYSTAGTTGNTLRRKKALKYSTS